MAGRLSVVQCDQDGCTTAVTDADIAASVAVAKTVETVIVNVAVTSTEGFDRFNLSLGRQQDSLVSQVAEANPNTVRYLKTFRKSDLSLSVF